MITLVNQAADSWWSWMGPMLWQVSLLIVIVSVIDLLIAKWAWPQVRYALWLLVLVKLLIPPTWSSATSVISQTGPWVEARIAHHWGIDSSTPAQPRIADEGAGPVDEEQDAAAGAVPGRSTPTTGSPASAAARGNFSWKSYALAVWIAGMVFFALLLARRIAKLHRWHREQEERQTIPPWFHELMVGTAQRLKLDRLPAIVFSEEAVTPAVYGVFRPVLLLPANYADALSREEAEHVLLHELAHLKRGDLWINGLNLMLQIVYWFNPLLIWVGKQMRHVREICCDLSIANVLREKTSRYRKTLLDTARELLTESLEPGMGLLGVFEEPFRLVPRLRWLEKDTWRNRGWMKIAAAGVVLIAVPCLLPMAALQTDATAATPTATEARPTPTEPGATPSESVLIRDETRKDWYTLGFRTASELLKVTELWVGDGRAALIEENWQLILDRNESSITFVNPRSKSYVEIELPVDMSTLLSVDLQKERRQRLQTGTVVPTGDRLTLLDRECDEFAVVLWEERDGERTPPVEITVWATTDLDFDYSLVNELLDNMRLIFGRDERSREELRKIRGVQVLLSMERGNLFKKEVISEEAVEISRSVPPGDVFAPPQDYTRRDRLTRDDF
jgi:beta-lactamase regulating signal transducer with metallopeptidase domain